MEDKTEKDILSCEKSVKKLPHHDQQPLCMVRPLYRQGRKLTAVKVYTINDESKYIIINGVPDIKIEKEFCNLCLKYGPIEKVNPLPDYPNDAFERTYLVKYSFIKNARFAKKQLDGKSFFGGILHVFYAPELESVEETREKLVDRRKAISFLLRKGSTKIQESHKYENTKERVIRRLDPNKHLHLRMDEYLEKNNTNKQFGYSNANIVDNFKPQLEMQPALLKKETSTEYCDAEKPSSSFNLKSKCNVTHYSEDSASTCDRPMNRDYNYSIDLRTDSPNPQSCFSQPIKGKRKLVSNKFMIYNKVKPSKKLKKTCQAQTSQPSLDELRKPITNIKEPAILTDP